MLKCKKERLGQVRIIGGKWRGRKIEVLPSPGLRPTADRIKETLFNWLMGELAGRRCLDCFAGSGSLGLEALSRSAKSVYFLEENRQVSLQIRRNLEQLSATMISQVECVDTLGFLAKKGQPFDIVFVDPPFRRELLGNTLFLLEENGWLSDKAWIYVEFESEKDDMTLKIPKNWQLYRQKVTGQVSYRLYYREVSESL